jgi:diketogulonate reductase-like aldo/keto reductase
MPRIIYGTAWKKDATAGLVEQALEAGFRGIDTACQPKHYHEPGVGDGIAATIQRGLLTRDQLYLQSKFTPLNGQDPERIPYDPKAELAQQVEQSFQSSLRNLQTDYLDGLVLHSPLADRAQLLTVWRAMEAIYQSGAVRQLGISNCYDPGLLALLHGRADIKPVIVQNRFYADTGYDTEIRAFCDQHDMVYQSFWTLTANPGILASAEIKSLAAKYKRSPAQVFFRYLTQIGIVPLTGTTSAQHMREDLAIFEFELNGEELEVVGSLF